jgi:hypothetical protein
VRNITNNFIKKIFGSGYISRNAIANELVRARQSEANRINKIRDEQERQNIEMLRLEHDIECDGFRAEIRRLEAIISEGARRRAESERLYFKNQRYAKNNALITAEMERQGQSLLNNISGFIQGIKNIGDKAATNLSIIERKK